MQSAEEEEEKEEEFQLHKHKIRKMDIPISILLIFFMNSLKRQLPRLFKPKLQNQNQRKGH